MRQVSQVHIPARPVAALALAGILAALAGCGGQHPASTPGARPKAAPPMARGLSGRLTSTDPASCPLSEPTAPPDTGAPDQGAYRGQLLPNGYALAYRSAAAVTAAIAELDQGPAWGCFQKFYPGATKVYYRLLGGSDALHFELRGRIEAGYRLFFRSIDADQDGAITPVEGLRVGIGAARFADLDRNGDSALSAKEFAAGAATHRIDFIEHAAGRASGLGRRR